MTRDALLSLALPGMGQLLQRRLPGGLAHLYVAILLWVIVLGTLIAGHDPAIAALFPVLFHLASAAEALSWRWGIWYRIRI
jgi:hypothetical protein